MESSSSTITTVCHPHLLQKSSKLTGWDCNGKNIFGSCKNKGRLKSRYRCQMCDFDLCFPCIEYSFNVSKFHDCELQCFKLS